MSDQCLAQLALSHHSRDFHCDKARLIYHSMSQCVAPLRVTDRSRLRLTPRCQAELGPATAPEPVRRMWSPPGVTRHLMCRQSVTITRTGPTVARESRLGPGDSIS